ncbi:MAG: hypothetical protein JWO32_2767 [Bacteroidetes bacterium]|nr:hypothetical protein [Bacteroidota bacterium]
MAIAAVLMLDLAIRIGDLEAFYSNTGAVPLTMLFEHSWNDYFVSLHAMSGLWQFQFILFLVAWFCAIMLFIGYRTRLFTVLSWFMLLSMHNRNGLILQGGDDLLRMVLFWGMFLPWGARYSCDSLLSPQKYEHKTILTVAAIAYLLQICYIYSGSALLKGTEWSKDFTAMYFVYGLDQIVYAHSKALFYYPELLKKLTFIAYYFELFVPVLFFIPVKHQWFRLSGIILIILFHLLNASTLFIGLFPIIGIVTSLGLLPAFAMDKLELLFYKVKIVSAGSFINIATYLNRILRWKQPVYIRPDWMENTKMALLIFLVVFVFDWNFSNLSFINSKLSDGLRPLGYALRLDQNWGMFAPGVFKDDGWYILEGVTEKNKTLNLLQEGKDVSYLKPASVTSLYKNDRWRKYTENMILSYNTFMRGYFCNYYKRVWNENSESKIRTLRIVYMNEFTLPDYKYSPASREVLWECEGS